jgi:hypothetical protein
MSHGSTNYKVAQITSVLRTKELAMPDETNFKESTLEWAGAIRRELKAIKGRLDRIEQYLQSRDPNYPTETMN